MNHTIQTTDDFNSQNVQTHDYGQTTTPDLVEAGSDTLASSADSSDSNNSFDNQNTETKPKKTPLIIQAVRARKGLYPKIETAMLKQVSTRIRQGKTAIIKPDKFIFDLIERGLKSAKKYHKLIAKLA